jgi:hypothetical protein
VYSARARWMRSANPYPVFIGLLIELSEFSRRLSVEKLHTPKRKAGRNSPAHFLYIVQEVQRIATTFVCLADSFSW